MTDEISHKLKTRHLRPTDYKAIQDISERVYNGVAVPWTEEEIGQLITKFPEGQICIEDNGIPVAIALSLIIDFSLFGEQHSYEQIVRGGTFKSHDSEGDYLYGIAVSVDPEYQGMRLGRRLYDARKELAEVITRRSLSWVLLLMKP